MQNASKEKFWMPTERQLICEKLKQARQDAELKQETVARHLKISTSAVSAFESGNRKVDACELYLLSRLYHKPMEWFFSDYLDLKLLASTHQGTSIDDPLVHQCLELLGKAPQNKRRAAAYGLLGFLAPDASIPLQ
jgi:transcriptional regulator with XRE-family HTH domain